MVLMNISNLRDEVVAEQSTVKSDKVVESFIASLDEDTRNVFEELLVDNEIQTRALWKVLRSHGLIASETTFRVFRQGRINAR